MTDKEKETFETWNRVASAYEEKFMKMDFYNDSYDRFLELLPRQAKVLDLGCGPGNISHYLLTHRADLDILGTDIAGNMVELAAKNNPTARFQIMDSREILNLPDTFDGIISGFCLPYLSEEECGKLFFDAYQLLNKNGTLYLSFVEGDPLESGFKSGSGGRVFFQYHLLDILVNQLTEAGFEILDIVYVNYPVSENQQDVHTIIHCRKINQTR